MIKNDEFVIGSVLFFIAGFYSWPLLANSNLGLDGSDLTGAIATLIAAYVGAKFAFKLNEKKKEEEFEINNKKSIHKFMMKLFLITNDLLQIEKYYLLTAEKYHPKERHLFLLSPGELLNNKYSFDLNDIDFIMQPKNIDLLTKTVITIDSYRNSIDVINKRTMLHDEAQIIFNKSGLQQGQLCKAVELEKLIGPLLNENLKIATDASIEFTKKTINDLFEVKNDFLKTVKEIYPSENFIDYKRPEY